MIRALRILTSNPLSLLGLVLVALVVIAAIFAPWIAPYPTHNGAVVDFLNNNRAPSAANWMGTDLVGRDIFSRILYAYQISLTLGVVVLAIATPVGTIVGLLAGYIGGWTESILMRIVDVFLSIPPLVLAIAMMGVLETVNLEVVGRRLPRANQVRWCRQSTSALPLVPIDAPAARKLGRRTARLKAEPL